MGIKLSQLGSKEIRTAVVEYEGDTLNITYRAGRMTPRVQAVSNELFQISKRQRDRQKLIDEGQEPPEDEDRGQTMEEIAEALDGFLGVLADTLTGWDIIDDEGKPLPITRDILELIPFELLSAIFSQIMSDNAPNVRSAAS